MFYINLGKRVLVVCWLGTDTLCQAVQDHFLQEKKEFGNPNIFTSLTPYNSMSSTTMFFSETAHCIASIFCKHGKERG